MALFILLVYLVLTYLRPWEFYPELARYRLSFWTGNAGFVAALGGFLISGYYAVLSVPALYFMVFFFVLVILSPAIASGWLGGVMLAFTAVMVNLVGCFLIVFVARTVRAVRVIAATICVLMVIVVIQGALAYYGYFATEQLVMLQRLDTLNEFGEREGFGRVRGLGQLNDPNDLAQALAATAPLLWPFWRPNYRFRNFFLVIAPSLILMYGVFLTRSRGGFLSVLIIIMLFIRERTTRFRLLGPVVIAAVLAAVMLASGFTGGRSMSDSSSEGRLEAWYDGLQMLRGHPLFGVGAGNFVNHHIRAAHNSFVHCFAEMGLVGYFLWIGILIAVHTDLSTMRTAEDEDDEEQQAIADWATAVRFSLYAFLSGAFFLSRTYATTLFTVVGFAIALSAMARRSGWVATNWDLLLKRTTVVSSLSVVAIYVFVRVAMAAV